MRSPASRKRDSRGQGKAVHRTPTHSLFPHPHLSTRMQRRKCSNKSRMTRIPSDDEGPVATLKVPSTRYQLLTSGNFASSSQILHLPSSNLEKPKVISVEDVGDTISGAAQSVVDYIPPQLDGLDLAYLERLDEEFITVKRPRTYVNPVNRWLAERDTFLAELLRWEGRGDYISTACSFCRSFEGVSYRCVDCTGSGLLCQGCILLLHRFNPLHRIESWTENTYFKKVTLKELGLRIQLGHKAGDKCWNRQVAKDFVVLDVNGIHEVGVDFCDCEKSKPEFIQLLRYGWFPASVDRPKTAATFSVLKHFQLLNFESKASPFEFYNTLARLTDNTGLSTPRGRYPSFCTMIREYRHMKMLKRAMRGYDPHGVMATKPGECAVLCPACPQPGLNLEHGWELVSHKRRFLYRLFLALDANFRLKRRNVSSEQANPSFSDGWSYFVSESKYKAYLAAFSDLIVQKRSTCSNHNAVNAERRTKGLAATGVGTVDCARHDMKRPLAVGDLLKGERYVNMDYMFFSSLRHSQLIELPEIIVSYDIACQWSINLWERMKVYPQWMHINHTGQSFHFLVPKFHLPAHIMACQTVFSFNFNRHVGRTEGEAPERGWAQINPVATSTSEMGPGHRRDTLDDHFGDGNWRKTTSIAVSLLRKIKEAVVESNDQKFLHHQYVLGLPEASAKKWEQELVEWEEDHSKPNPFEKRFKTITQDGVRKRLAVEEAAQMAAGTAYVLHEEVSASQLITMGLDFEEQQRQLAVDLRSLGPHSTDEQKTRLQYRANVLRRKISSWIGVQHLYIPGLHVLRDRDDRLSLPNQPEEPVPNIKLYLPSAIRIASKVACDARLCRMECDLRQAQAQDALHDLRDSLRLRSHIYMDKDRFQRGQRQNTRSRGLVDRLEVKVTAAAAKYRAARRAISTLAPSLNLVGWEVDFPLLNDSDIKGLSDSSTPAHSRPSEGRREITWIWTQLGTFENHDELLQDDLRIEFCKSKARADRWAEEVELLQEEMKRVKLFFHTQAGRWAAHADTVRKTNSATDSAIAEGLCAYANAQAAQFYAMRSRAEHLWRYVDKFVALGQGEVVPAEAYGGADDDENM